MAERARGIVGKVYGSRDLLPDERVIDLMGGTRPADELLVGEGFARSLPDPDVWRRLVAPVLDLAPGDAEVVRWLVTGLSHGEIARRLDMPVTAVQEIAGRFGRAAEARSGEPRETGS